MRLTNEDRRTFAKRVMKQIPIKSEWTRDKIIEEVKKRLFDALPQAGFDDTDFEPLFKRPTWQE